MASAPEYGGLPRTIEAMARPAPPLPDKIEIIRRTVAAFNAGHGAQARSLCEGGLKTWPQDPALNHLLAAIRFAAGEQQGAAAAIETALAAGANGAAVHLLAARILAASQPALALRHFEQAIAAAPSPEALTEYARLLTASGAATAAAAWRAVLKSAPGSNEAKARLGRLLWEAGEFAEAARLLEEAAASEAPATLWFDLALVRQDLKDRTGAIAAYRRALERRPDLAEAAVNLGILLQDGADMDAAWAAYCSAYRAKPSTFGMIATALTSAPHGRLWLDREALRRALAG